MPQVIAPEGSGHAGPDWIRIQAIKDQSGKTKNQGRQAWNEDRDEMIRELAKQGARPSDLATEYKLQVTTIKRIILGVK